MSEYKFISTDRILAKLSSELRNSTLHEADILNWIGEALEFLDIYEIHEQAVAFINVENYTANLPSYFHRILQVAKHRDWTNEKTLTLTVHEEQKEEEEERLNCCPDCPYQLDTPWDFTLWTTNEHYIENFTPVRLANHSFFNTLVCKEKDMSPYQGKTGPEYTIIGKEILKFSFEEGLIALSYIRNKVDPQTCLPMIPDDINFITAITYYIKWKLAEMYDWDGREGFSRKVKDNRELWYKYARQAKNIAKMPKTSDDFQDLLEQSHYLIPRHNRYYGFFGNLGRAEDRKFIDSDNRNIARYYTDNRYGK